MSGIPQGAMEGGAVMSRDGRQIFAPAKSAFPPSMAVVLRKEPWKAVRLCPGMDGRFLLLGNCSCVALISYIHVTMQNLHFHHPWRSYSAKSD